MYTRININFEPNKKRHITTYKDMTLGPKLIPKFISRGEDIVQFHLIRLSVHSPTNVGL